MRSAAVLALACGVAFAVRVIPARHAVFTPAGVNFQDDDSWFHMRSVHNLAAHFPRQSGFDPYAIFPGGQVLNPEPWDFTLAAAAWILGFGRPSPHLIDLAGAWLPPLVGALLAIPVYFLGRRLFGELAGLLAALAIAVAPGTILWETHLGVPDHHAGECLLSLLALVWLCRASDDEARRRLRATILAGLALGIYLCVRPAGIFVPGAVALAALLEPLLAPVAAGAIGIAGAIFLTSSGNKWTHYTWAALAASLLACALAFVLGRLWRRKQWPAAALPLALALALAIAGATAAAINPARFFAVVANFRRFLPGGSDVYVNTIVELQAIWRAPPGGLTAIFENLGGLWPFALIFLVAGVPQLWRGTRPALKLFTVWAVVMTAGGFLQLRMNLYSAPVIAILAGAAAAWAIGKMPRFQAPAIAVFAVFTFCTTLPASIRLASADGGLTTDWRAALAWLSQNTPDPMGNPAAWLSRWERPGGGRFHFPASAWGVLTWWDSGDQIDAIAHRIPNTNGTQVHAEAVASFLMDDDPDRARLKLAKLGSRYIALDSQAMTRDWPGIVLWAAADDSRYRRPIIVVGPNGPAPAFVYLADYYRTMATRLYTFDGKASVGRVRFAVYTLRRRKGQAGKDYDFLISERAFPSDREAWDFMAVNTGETMIFGSMDPTLSCVEFGAIPWASEVFNSDAAALSANRAPKAVKIFGVAP